MYANLWFQLQWPESWSTVAIAPKELVPIVMAVILWGPYWAGKWVRCLCDNISVVAAVNKGAARDPALSSLLRTLVSLTARHLPGVQNTSADALSRDKLPLFFSLNPSHHPSGAAGTGAQHVSALDKSRLDEAGRGC